MISTVDEAHGEDIAKALTGSYGERFQSLRFNYLPRILRGMNHVKLIDPNCGRSKIYRSRSITQDFQRFGVQERTAVNRNMAEGGSAKPTFAVDRSTSLCL